MRNIKNILLLLIFCVADFAFSQSPVYAQVSSKKVQVGTAFEYAIIITVNASGYTPPNLKDFDIVSGPNQSSSTQIVNGVVSSQISLSWGLVPRKEGKYTIGPAVVTSGSTRYETNPVQIEITKGPVSQSSQGTADAGTAASGDNEVFVKAIPSKTKVYEGEQLTVTYKVFSRASIVGMKKYDPPTFDGFWAKRLDLPSTAGQQEVIDGVAYVTAEVDKHLLYANSGGKKTLKPAEMTYIVRRLIANKKPRNIFEQFFGGQQYQDVEVTVKCNPVNIETLPLPEEGKPESFNGAVGKLNWSVETNRTSLKANDAFNLKISIAGNGNFPLMSAPKLNLPESFETYNPKITENNNSKTFEYLVIPRQEGEFALKDLNFSYFNLETKKYVTLSSPEILIKVAAPDPNSTGAQVYQPQNQIRESENDIRYIKKGDFELTKTEEEFFNSPAHLGFLSGPVLLLILGLVARRNYIKNNSDIIAVKERKAAKVARKQLSTAENLMQQNRKDEFYTEVLTAINNYISFKLNIPVAELSREKMQEKLMQKSVNPELILKLLKTVETGEYAKYAPGAVSGDLQQVYKDTVSLITGIEENLNKRA